MQFLSDLIVYYCIGLKLLSNHVVYLNVLMCYSVYYATTTGAAVELVNNLDCRISPETKILWYNI